MHIIDVLLERGLRMYVLRRVLGRHDAVTLQAATGMRAPCPKLRLRVRV